MRYRAGTTQRRTMRMDKSKNKLSCIESVRFTRRALKTYYAASSVHVIVYIAIMAWEALTPYRHF